MRNTPIKVARNTLMGRLSSRVTDLNDVILNYTSYLYLPLGIKLFAKFNRLQNFYRELSLVVADFVVYLYKKINNSSD